MSFSTFVALRYLATSRKTAHVALISAISILGLAVGVAALTVSLALLSGFQDRIRAQMAERTPHLAVSPARGSVLADPERARRALAAAPGVVAVEPVIEGRGWLARVDGGSALPVRFRNASPADLPHGDEPRVRLAGPAAFRLGVGEGDLLRLTSARTRLSPIGPIPVSVALPVAEVVRRGPLEKAPEVEVPEATARLLASLPEGAQAYEARLANPAEADRAAARVASALGAGYRVETWRERNRPLSFALRLEKSVIFATVALVILVAAFNVVSNVALLVVEKKRDLGVLATLGAAPRELSRIYLALGAWIGAIGTTAGLLLGVGLSLAADRYGWVPLPPDVYVFSHVPFAVHVREVVLIALFAFGTALAASVLPARAAARVGAGEAVGLSR